MDKKVQKGYKDDAKKYAKQVKHWKDNQKNSRNKCSYT